MVVTSPAQFPDDARKKVFLAGAIDMGRAIPWQRDVIARLADLDVVVFNPRRDDWQPSWTQALAQPQFVEQVDWELRGLEMANVVLMVLPAESTAPISLLELGLCARQGGLIVVVEPGFWRRANVQLVCERYEVPCVSNLVEGIALLRDALAEDNGWILG